MSSIMRITGFSGFDVDSTVQQLMKAESAKVDKVKQQRQILQWKQQLYRDTISDLNTFKSTYFDVLKSDTYMLSSKNYSTFSVTPADTNSKVTATATAGAVSGNYTVNVGQVAKAASITGKAINVEQALSTAVFPVIVDSTNNIFEVSNEYGTYDITLDTGSTYNNLAEMASALNSKMSTVAADGTNKLSDRVQARVSSDGTSIEFVKKIEITDLNKNITIDVGGTGYTVELTTGNLTTSDIASQINSKLSTLSGFPTGVTAESVDGQTIRFKDTSDGSIRADITTSVSTTLPTISGDGGVATSGGSTSTELNFTTNKFTAAKQIISGKNDTLTFNIQGTTYNIQLDAANYTGQTNVDIANDLKTKINTKLAAAGVATDTLQASVSSDGKLQFIGKDGKQISVSGSAARTLGFSSSFEISQSSSDSINNLVDGKVDFTINGVNFKYDFSKNAGDATLDSGYTGGKGKSISSIMSEIATKANVNINYSELTRSFSITTRSTGASQAIVASDTTGQFLSTIFGDGSTYNTNTSTPAGVTVVKGQDAAVTITAPGSTAVTVTKATNSFTIDGVTYNIDPTVTLNTDISFTVSQNPDAAFDKIVQFIGKYNDMIEKLNKKIDEKRQFTYQPLTDDEKKSLKENGEEDMIEELEEKAKQGLLKNDSTISNMLASMRRAFYDTVKDAGITLSEIGLSTSPDTTQRGKIVIDADKLKEALRTDGDKIAKLFTQQSTSKPIYSADMSSVDRSKRYEEQGIFQRINDILQDNVRMTRDSSGNKGFLIQKAGIVGDITDTLGMLPQQIKEKDDLITRLNQKLSDKESFYYKQFTAMEKALSQLNSQSSWLASQLGMSG